MSTRTLLQLEQEPLPTQDQRREHQMASLLGLDWNPSMSGDDAKGHNGSEWELKSTGTQIAFAIGRDITPKKIDQCASRYWAFAFYESTTDDTIKRVFVVHPDALIDRWTFLRRKFAKAEYYTNFVWDHAKKNMDLEGLPFSLVEHIEIEINKVFNRGGQTLPNQSVPKGDIFRAVELGLGIEIDLDADVPAQVQKFEKAFPLKSKRVRKR